MNEWEWQALEDRTPLDRVPHPSGTLAVGARVRLRPRPRGVDAMDVLLAGRTAVVEAIEQDYDSVVHVALVFDDDPGRDLGLLRQPGHRFFYALDEVELCDADAEAPPPAQVVPPAPTMLIAGIGNIFLGDDGFGVEVARRLAPIAMPSGVRVMNYGIRGIDLAYALMEAPDVVVLVDACPRGEPPGTLSVIELDLTPDADEPLPVPDAHTMNPQVIIRLAQSMGGRPKRMLLVGCEPATLGPDEGQLGLSPEVSAVVDAAVQLVTTLVDDIRANRPLGDASHSQPEGE